MIHYDIAKITKRARPQFRARIVLPKIEERLGAVKSYTRLLRQLVASIAREVGRSIIPALQAERGLRITHDADENTFNALKATAETLTTATTQAVNRILDLESIKHTETFIDVARKTLGIDVSSVVSQEDIAEYLRTAAARNASLIKSLSADTIKKVEQAVYANTLAGGSVKALKKQLVTEFGVSTRRADLIAADQTAKLTSDLNRIRQTQAEIDSYEWSTSHDERVRPLHQSIDGTEYRWDQSTDAEGGLAPGQPIRCRCTARGVVEFGPRVKAAPVPVPVEPEADALEATAKNWVLETGRKDGKEHLTAYSATFKLPVEQVSSNEVDYVGITPALNAAMKVPGNRVIVHHNHPGSNSFSKADLIVLHGGNGSGWEAGLEGVWAHGHNGSSYFAKRGAKAMTAADFDTIDKEVRAAFEPYVNAATLADLNRIHWHTVATILHQRGFIDYIADLKDFSKEAFERHKDLFEKATKK